MSEKGLNNTLRELGVARGHLNMAEVYSETQVNDNNVTSMIHDINLSLQELMRELNVTYRASHYKTRR